jgi:Zn-dependent protease with chaperone function
MAHRRILNQLYANEYEHPFDQAALNRLERTPGVDLLTRRLLDWGLEKYLRLKYIGNNLRVTHRNIPEVHTLLLEACRILDMEEVPELYLQLEDKITAFTSGEQRCIIVVSSGAVELLDDGELLFLLARELGHIRSRHVTYRMMAESLTVMAQLISDVTLGLGNMLSMPVQLALMYWYRMSEFTADRAGLLTVQDIDIAGTALIKMAGLPAKFAGRVTLSDLRHQAVEFDDLNFNNFDKLIRFAAGYENPQPFIVIRASQLFQWVESGEYQAIIDRPETVDIPPHRRCRQCKQPFSPDDTFCRYCGTKLPHAAL